MMHYRDTAVRRAIPYRQTGLVEYDEFYPRLVKESIDLVDQALQDEFALSDGQLDYLMNYDIRYRMGQDAEDGDD